MAKLFILKALAYYLLLPFLYLLSILPLPFLYGIADLLYLVLFRLLGYRKKVVMENLQRSFPEKDAEAIKALADAYYRHLCDLIVESLKTLGLSKEKIWQHAYFHPEALALFQQLAEQGQSAIALMGHQGNWEWSSHTFGTQIPEKLFVIYRPLSNPYFDRLMYRIRARFGAHPITMNQTLRTLLASKEEPSVTAFLADQAPPPTGAYWTQFLHQETPFFMGAEKIARRLNYPVLYISVHKEKRGHYLIRAVMLEDQPRNAEAGDIMERFARLQEQDIRQQPETWLWSHRRWKHQRPKPNQA